MQLEIRVSIENFFMSYKDKQLTKYFKHITHSTYTQLLFEKYWLMVTNVFWSHDLIYCVYKNKRYDLDLIS